MTNVRVAVISYFGLAVLGGLFLEQVLRLLWGAAGWTDFQILGEDWTLTTLIGFVTAFAAAFGAWMKPSWREASLEVVQELRRVTWPTWAETRTATVAVIVTSVVVAAILGLFDLAWAELTKIIYEAPRYIG